MATSIQRAKAIADAITNIDTPAGVQSGFADDCIAVYPANFTPANPQSPTNAERAECVVRSLRQWAKSVREAAEDVRSKPNEATIRATKQSKLAELGSDA